MFFDRRTSAIKQVSMIKLFRNKFRLIQATANESTLLRRSPFIYYYNSICVEIMLIQHWNTSHCFTASFQPHCIQYFLSEIYHIQTHHQDNAISLLHISKRSFHLVAYTLLRVLKSGIASYR